jgi:hypothetical protein
MQTNYECPGATSSAELNALVRALPGSWSSKIQNLYNRLQRVDHIVAYEVWYEAAQMLATAKHLGEVPEVDTFSKAVQLVLNAARDRARAGA